MQNWDHLLLFPLWHRSNFCIVFYQRTRILWTKVGKAHCKETSEHRHGNWPIPSTPKAAYLVFLHYTTPEFQKQTLSEDYLQFLPSRHLIEQGKRRKTEKSQITKVQVGKEHLRWALLNPTLSSNHRTQQVPSCSRWTKKCNLKANPGQLLFSPTLCAPKPLFLQDLLHPWPLTLPSGAFQTPPHHSTTSTGTHGSNN